ncbi:hypothetical protein [Pararhodobacter zhoushanensis]|uniref:hypothetical protein n=1 Tax=Pararhodobacter zhoushanensis TaxID=2479545 RepID=UPI000F8D56D6|nr:hypothetical protein [Pararhodobacter zhoushanensis]
MVARRLSTDSLRTVCVVLGLGMLPGTVLAQNPGPLSAIDWLQTRGGVEMPGAYPITPPVASSVGGSTGISVRALDALRPEAVGLYPAARVGLPAALWGTTPARALSDLIADLPADMLPSLRELSLRLLLAEFNAPLPGTEPSPVPDFLLTRIDKLIEFGALDQAAAVLDTLDSDAPVLRLRRFDIGLLLGDEHTACQPVLREEPPVGDAAALIFCMARAGQWQEASALLDAAAEENRVAPYLAELLQHFLDGDETLPGASTLLPPPPGTPDPLTWRLREAVGDGLPTLGLPVSYAHADLRGTQGWRAQIEAAERLVRAGALSPNRLLGLYTERRAAASGGIWERVRVVQRLDTALRNADAAATSAALIEAWPQIQAGELEVPMASLYAQPLGQIGLTGEARAIAYRIGLLSEAYETVALGLPAGADAEERFLAAVARGLDPAQAGAMPGELAAAVTQAFGPEPPLPDGMAERLAEGRLGEEMLRILMQLGGPGDPRVLAEGLGGLRALGLEDIARRTALESLLLERRG